ncbi:MAG: ABC transporter substrate-binding protein [Verrucomicrobia bacterium]|nr:ABC transporter substrate-binding protein [Verrucomicrobiota bacterium]
MEHTLRLGYLSSFAVAPLLVAVDKFMPKSNGLRVDVSLEIGWGPMLNHLQTGKLDGAVLPPSAPFFLNTDQDPGGAAWKGCAALGFGGTRIVANNSVLAALNEDHPLQSIKFGYSIGMAGEVYYLRKWLRDVYPDFADIELVPVAISVTQRSEFLRAGLIDTFVCVDPWAQLAANGASASVINCGASFERSDVCRVLTLNSGWLHQHPRQWWVLFDALQQAAEWCEQSENQPELLRVLSEDRPELGALCESGDCLLNPFARSVRAISPHTGTVGLEPADMKTAWSIYRTVNPHLDLADTPPLWAEEIFLSVPLDGQKRIIRTG